MSIMAAGFLLAFAAVLVLLGWVYGDVSDAEQFNMGGRKVGWIRLTFGVFTVVGAGELVGVTAFTKSVGLFSFTLFIGIAIGALILAFGTRAAHKLAGEKKFQSLPDFVAYRYGRISSLLTALVNVSALGALLLIQFAIGGVALAHLLSINPVYTILLLAGVVAAYVWLGGLKAILITDVVQGTAMFLFLGFLFLVTIVIVGPQRGPNVGLTVPSLGQVLGEPAAWQFVLVLFVAGVTAVSGGADLWLRVFIGDQGNWEHSVRRGFLFSALFFLVFGLGLSFVSVEIWSQLPAATDENLAFEIYLLEHVPITLFALGVVGLFAAVISTADAELHVLSVVISSELNRWRKNPKIEDFDTR